jgi:hypothetical protein
MLVIGKRALTALCTLPALAGCQDMRAFVTGETFVNASADSERIEIELVVEFHDGFFDSFADKEEVQELRRDVKDLVIDLADVGLRFYPIELDKYGSQDVRPAHVMYVTVEELTFDTRHEWVERDGGRTMKSTLEGTGCRVSASVQQRRDGAPSLVVVRSEGTGDTHADNSPGGLQRRSYRVKRESPDHERLRVAKPEVLNAVEEAVIDALRDIVKPVDRHLATQRAAQ